MDTAAFNQGQKPAIDIGRSVSRVGSAAQRPAVRKLVGNLKLELSQYKEVEHFTRFGTEVDDATNRQVQKGKRILGILKQKPHQPLAFHLLTVLLFALDKGCLDSVLLDELDKFQKELLTFFQIHEAKLLGEIDKEGKLTEEITTQLIESLDEFTLGWFEKEGGPK